MESPRVIRSGTECRGVLTFIISGGGTFEPSPEDSLAASAAASARSVLRYLRCISRVSIVSFVNSFCA